MQLFSKLSKTVILNPLEKSDWKLFLMDTIQNVEALYRIIFSLNKIAQRSVYFWIFKSGLFLELQAKIQLLQF